MNKIHVVDNKIIPFDNTDVILNNNIITFTNNGDYYLEYITSDNVNITINIEDNVCVQLFEYSNNNDINFNIKYNLDMASSLIISKFYYNNRNRSNLSAGCYHSPDTSPGQALRLSGYPLPHRNRSMDPMQAVPV